MDGTLEHQSETFVGERWSVVAFLHNATLDLAPRDRDSLNRCGFELPADRAHMDEHAACYSPLSAPAPQGSRQEKESRSRVHANEATGPEREPWGNPKVQIRREERAQNTAVPEPVGRQVSAGTLGSELGGDASSFVAGCPRRVDGGAVKRVTIEFCCSPESVIGAVAGEYPGCEVVRVTEERDARRPATRDWIFGAIVENRTLLWCSIPCTGGSAWRRLIRRHPGAQERIDRHVALFRELWDSFVIPS